MKPSFFKKFYYICLFLLSLGQLVAFGRGEGGAFYLFDLFIFLFAIIGIIYFLIGRKKFIFPKNSVFLLFFILIGTTSLLLHLTTLDSLEFGFSIFYLIRFVLYFIASLVVYNMHSSSLISMMEFKNSLYLSALLISVLGFLQLIILPDFTVLDPSLGWDPHKNRLASTFFDPNFTGGYLALILGLFLGDLLVDREKLSIKQVLFFFVIPLCALLLTFSRSSWGMFATIVFVIGMFKNRKIIFIALVLAFLTYFAVPRVQTRITGTTDPADSAAFRLVSWSNAFEIIKDNVFLGVGFNTYRYAQKDYSFFEVGSLGGNSGSGADSSLMLVFATTGILGFLFFTAYFLSPILEFKSATLIAIFLGLFLHSQFVNSLFYPQILFLWLSLLNLRKTFYT